MALSDMFKTNQLKEKIAGLEAENTSLKNENTNLKQLLTPEMQNAISLQNKISEFNQQLSDISSQINQGNKELNALDQAIHEKKSKIIWMDDEILVQEFGLYQSKYAFENSELYKMKLDNIRSLQKQSIKHNKAVTGSTTWTVNGDAKQGKKMVNDMHRRFRGKHL